MNIFNPYVRKHFHSLQISPTPSMPSDASDPASFLNLNINSFSETSYKFYPNTEDQQLALQYLEFLKNNAGNDFALTPDNILFTQGSAEGVDLLIRAYCEPKEDSITVAMPTFPYYAYRASIENVAVHLTSLEGPDYTELDINKILGFCSKLLFLCSPNNPVGTVLQIEQVETLLQSYNGLVVVDEAYLEWSNSDSFVPLIQKYDNLIILRTFSKIWGLAGVRCGVVIGNKKMVDPLRIVQTPFSFPDTSKNILLSKFKDISLHAQHKIMASTMRQELAQFLTTINFVKRVFPSQANFLFVQVQDADTLTKHLLKANILIKNVSDQVPNAVRISIGTDQEMSRLYLALQDFDGLHLRR